MHALVIFYSYSRFRPFSRSELLGIVTAVNKPCCALEADICLLSFVTSTDCWLASVKHWHPLHVVCSVPVWSFWMLHTSVELTVNSCGYFCCWGCPMNLIGVCKLLAGGHSSASAGRVVALIQSWKVATRQRITRGPKRVVNANSFAWSLGWLCLQNT